MDWTGNVPPVRPRSVSFSSLESMFGDSVYISHREGNGEPDSKPQDLAPAPRVSQPAIVVDEAKWRTLSSFLPLLQLLSAFTEVNGHYILSGPITDDDIHSFQEHAKHVKEFVHHPPLAYHVISCSNTPLDPCNAAQSTAQPQSPFISSSVFLRLLTHQRTSLLPSLERLDVTHTTPDLQTTLTLFHTPSLTSVELVNLPDSPHLHSFLTSLYSESPGLESLTLRGPQRIPISSLSKIRELKILQKLVLDRVVDIEDYTVLQGISQLQYLTELVVRLDPDVQGGDLPAKSQYVPLEKASPGFAALELLRISAPFRLITDVLRNIASTSLKALDVAPIFYQSQYLDREHLKKLQDVEQREYDEAVKRLKNVSARILGDSKTAKDNNKGKVSLAASQCGPKDEGDDLNYVEEMKRKLERPYSSLSPESVTFESDYLKEVAELVVQRWPKLRSLTLSMTTPAKLPALSSEIRAFLSQLRSLEYLEIVHWDFASAEDLELLLSRLDKLKALKMPPGPDSCPVPLTNLNAIVASCPLLETLELTLDTIAPPTYVYPDLSALKRNRILKKIIIGSRSASAMGLTEKLRLARHLDYLFPNVSERWMCGFDSRFWEDIWDIVELCQRVRRDEREDVNVDDDFEAE